MFIFFLTLTIIDLIILLLVTAVRPAHSRYNLFELERRSKLGDKIAKKALIREKMLSDVASLQRIAIALLQVTVVLLSELTFGLVMGVIIALFMALGYGALARIGVMKNWSKKIYDHSEDNILYFIKKYSHLIKLLRGAPVGDTAYNSLRIESREEFQHLVTESDSVLTSDERKMIVNNLTFSDQLVKTIMTPRNMIVSISKTEFLGPLVLNDLHKVGHSRLPVIDKDIDHIVGILNLKTLLTLDIKKSATAEKVMDLKVYYIREDQTLHHALVALLHTHHHLLIVVDESRETVGILALEDIIEALLGRKIVDDFNDHDNIHAVVSRKNI